MSEPSFQSPSFGRRDGSHPSDTGSSAASRPTAGSFPLNSPTTTGRPYAAPSRNVEHRSPADSPSRPVAQPVSYTNKSSTPQSAPAHDAAPGHAPDHAIATGTDAIPASLEHARDQQNGSADRYTADASTPAPHQNGTSKHDEKGSHLVDPMLTLNTQELHRLSALFKLLSDRTRLAILQMLSGGEMNVTSLCERLKLPQPTVSHHLGLLRMNKLIDNRRDGKQVFYSLNGRISPAAVPDQETWAHTKAVTQAGVDEDPSGMQIIGRGFAIQILSSPDVDPRNFDAAEAAR